MTSVLITIDTEISPAAHQRGVSASENFANSILGKAEDGEWGIDYQIDRFNAHGLKAVFFVEALSATVLGLDFLKRAIEPILSSGHEVQLHAHTEWLAWFNRDLFSGRRGHNIADFPYEDQCRLLELGIENLTKAGAPRPIAFRAGNYGANNDTLRALASVWLKYDTSYNFPYLGDPCNIIADRQLLEPIPLDGVIELPISVFEDYPNHCRPAQLCAISVSEMRAVFEQSLAQQRKAAVIVSHSFELLNRARRKSNPIVVRRFERLCEMLHELRDHAPTKGFFELDENVLTMASAAVAPLRSSSWRTASRMVEQAIGSVLYG
jgi:hypothetical protein